MNYETLMKRAIALARRAEGQTEHYPMVGAVLVKDGEIISEGYFKKPGEPHAEVVAIRKAGKKAKGATLVLNLEPCAHYGRTPPCTKAIISAGIKKVVAGMIDPNPLVCGKGVAQLRQAGVEVIVGVLEKECKMLNRHFVKYITTQTPWVILKLALTADGKIADRYGNSKWITSEQARKFVHQLRSKVQVVMVGINTILQDDPLLNVRFVSSRNQPKALIIDSHLRIPLSAKILSRPKTIIACSKNCSKKRKEVLEKRGAEIIEVPSSQNGLSLKSLFKKLGRRKIASVLCEGGAHLAGSLLEEKLVDEIYLFYAPKLIIDEKALGAILGKKARKINKMLELINPKYRRIGSDFLLNGLLREV